MVLREINDFKSCQKQCEGLNKWICRRRSQDLCQGQKSKCEAKLSPFSTGGSQMPAKERTTFATIDPLISRSRLKIKHSLCPSCAHPFCFPTLARFRASTTVFYT